MNIANVMIIEDFKRDTEYTREITCPYCGYVNSDSWEFEGDAFECPDCENKSEVSKDVEITYSTRK